MIELYYFQTVMIPSKLNSFNMDYGFSARGHNKAYGILKNWHQYRKKLKPQEIFVRYYS